MKQWITGAAMIALALGYSQRADASIFLSISDGVNTVSCDNSGVCGAGFINIDANDLAFSGTVGGYTFGLVGVSNNIPGNVGGSFASDSKLSITNVSDTHDLVITFAAEGFTIPVGSGLSFSASDTGNWTKSVSGGDTGNFTAWLNNSNTNATSGTVATTPVCVGPLGTDTTVGCNVQSGNVGASNSGTFSLVGQETIHMAIGDNASFQATETVSAVPEPVTFSLMGIGLLGLGLLRKRIA